MEYDTSNTKTGYHRVVYAGTAHVFAVVGYDIVTASYFVSTYGDFGNHDYFAQTKNKTALKIEGTCKQVAVYYYSCVVCGACEKNDAHTFNGEYGKHIFTDTVTSATPISQGYTNHTCSTCGYSYKDAYMDYIEPDADTPVLTVSSTKACVGRTVDVTVDLSNNPGFNTFTLGFDYDASAMTLTNVALSDDLTGDFTYSKKAVFLGATDTTFDGELLTLTSAVADDAEIGEYPVTVTYQPGDICNLAEEDVNPVVMPGTISVFNHIPGDINGDDVVNNKDLNRLMKYLSGEDVEVVELALDVNGDGSVNNKDLNRLMKYLSGETVDIY